MTKVVVVGAGPVGLYSAIVLARRGNDVLVVDRDAGPEPDGSWSRRGVMQFRHPHFFRANVGGVFRQTAPDLWDAVVAAGGVPVPAPGAPDGVLNLQCRRSTFEAAIRAVATAQPDIAIRAGHADRVVLERGRVVGLIVDGGAVEADVVIDASGRSGRLGDDLRPAGDGGACGFSYVSRMYRVDDDAAAATLAATGVPLGQLYDGYLVIVFPQDGRTLSTLIVRASDDDAMSQLRNRDAFDAAMRAVPHLAQWTEPGRFTPITDVMPGGGLTNTYRTQARDVSGLYFVGDAVCTTNPAAGRGITLGLLQAQALIAILDEGGDDPAGRLEQWCAEHIRPWFEDHVYWDATLLRRFAGEDIDVEARIPSDVICAAAEVDPSIMAVAGPYQGMLAPPAILTPMQERVREILRTGWRPRLGDGPTRDDLVDLIGAGDAVSATR